MRTGKIFNFSIEKEVEIGWKWKCLKLELQWMASMGHHKLLRYDSQKIVNKVGVSDLKTSRVSSHKPFNHSFNPS